MTTEEIIRMAREAGIPFNKWGLIGCEGCEQDIDAALLQFATLVAASEREACAKVCEDYAKNKLKDEMPIAYVYGSRDCAAAIRARSNP